MDASTQLRLAYLAVGSAILFFWEGQELVSVGPCRGQNVEHRRCQDSRDGRLLASPSGSGIIMAGHIMILESRAEKQRRSPTKPIPGSPTGVRHHNIYST